MKKLILLSVVLIMSFNFYEYSRDVSEINAENTERGKLLRELEQDATTPSKYQISAYVMPEKREVRCEEILKFTNTSDVDKDRIYLNLFFNAFRDRNTTFFMESGIYRMTGENISGFKFGYIDIKSIDLINRGKKLNRELKFISPDDGNSHDKTVAEIKLDRSLKSGNSLWIKIKFVLKLPQIFFKTGQADDYIFLSHWFPRTGFLEKNGTWNVHQFHRRDRFVEDFGDFRVKINVPSRFKLGTTGTIVGSPSEKEGRTVYEVDARNVRDFAFVIFPYFKKFSRSIRLPGNNFNTTIILLLSPGHESSERRYMSAIGFSLKFLAEKVGAYPQRTLTVVDPPLKGFNSAGYKYPGLITTAYLKMIPYGLKITEMSIFQGVASQYWYGMVPGRDFEGIRIEDGISTFFEMELMDRYFQKRASFFNSFFLNIYDWEIKRMMYITPGLLDDPENVTMNFLMNKSYFDSSSFNVSLLLRSLKNYIGKSKFFDFFEYYFGRFKYRHIGKQDIFDTFGGYFKEDFSWAFDQFASQYPHLDTAVSSISSNSVAGKEDLFRNEVVFVRNSGYFPVDILIRLKSGKELKMFWKENKKWKKISFDDNSPIDYAAVDPDFKVPLDVNLVNNSKSLEKRMGFFNGLALRFGFLFQNILGFLPF